ncbi:hypothetical protein DI09_288p20, partial [Mitosporidium daphniae]
VVSTLILYSFFFLFIFFTIYQALFPGAKSTLAIATDQSVVEEFFADLDLSVSSPCDEIAIEYSRAGGYNVIVSHLLQMDSSVSNVCRISGRISLARVAGSIQIIPVGHVGLMEKNGFIQPVIKIDRRVSFNHTIHRLEFGDAFPNRISPLNGVSSSGVNENPFFFNQYFISIIPTFWSKKSILPILSSSGVSSFQYAAQSYSRSLSENAVGKFGIFMQFDFESVIIEQTNKSLFTSESGSFGELSLLIIQLIGVLGGLGAISDTLYWLLSSYGPFSLS